MTQSNTQSVRNEAESANAVTRIPTFEEVYAMPYVQESIKSVITVAIHSYPILASYHDDILQDILIHLNEDLPNFDKHRSGIKTYVRLSIETGLKMAFRRYLTYENYVMFTGRDVDLISDHEVVSAGFIDIDMLTILEYREMEDAASAIPDPVLRRIVDLYLDGKRGFTIARMLNIPLSTFYKYYFPRVKSFFQAYFPESLFPGGRIA